MIENNLRFTERAWNFKGYLRIKERTKKCKCNIIFTDHDRNFTSYLKIYITG